MNTIHHTSTKKIALLVAAIGILALSCQAAFAQSNDFFSNTQSTDLRAAAGTPTAPGFDPCRGGTTINSTTCSGATAGSEPLLDAVNLTTLFPKLGPGAVTDNMFGKVERPTGAFILQCNSGASFGADRLNCGDGKWDPSLEGQTLPTAGTNLTSAMAVNTPIDMDSGSGTAAHHHSQMESGFVWNPTNGAITVPVNTANMPNIVGAPTADSCAAGSTANPRVCGQDSLIETTAFDASTEVVVSLATSWSTTNDAAGTMGGNPTVSWRSHIVQGEFVGGGTFDQTLQGSFVYNGTNPSFNATQYPNGESFTIRAGGGGSPVETIP
ncbi:MAG: hypothetical protein HY282_06335 [Nitrospirae bacterium]|nr:hypothetical protein [Candidatus Manganitrophaceae bacterium]